MIEEISPDGDSLRKQELPNFPDLFMPDCLAISEDNKLFIADYDGDKVFLLNASRNEHQIILNREHRIDGPSRLCFLPTKQQLIVGQFRTPFVLIFKCYPVTQAVAGEGFSETVTHSEIEKVLRNRSFRKPGFMSKSAPTIAKKQSMA